MQVLLWITFVVLCLYTLFSVFYFFEVLSISGSATSFLWFWPVTCFIAVIAGVFLLLVVIGKLPRFKAAVAALCGLFWACVLVFAWVEVKVMGAARKGPKPGAEYVIVLGAQVRGEHPTLVLGARIRAAAAYLKENPEAVAIASGGQGTGESISEAEAIRRGLLSEGIEPERILLEDRSTSTTENLKFSAEMIEKEKSIEEAKVVIVTNDFHVYRAVKLAKKQGYAQVSGLGATDFFAVTIQYYVREFFAITKEWLWGNF